MTELKPCPFCGASAELKHYDIGVYCVTCSRCFASMGGYPKEEQVVEAWNRRVPDINIEMAKAKGYL